jgi:UDP-N-acetylglucosamine--N-acetylmuramyl-(pentapeptide) pyrophosphoryl-undecaprenol N-acetylglucosamine transferase
VEEKHRETAPENSFGYPCNEQGDQDPALEAIMNVLFASGGTGGHIYPGIALAEELRRRVPDAKVLFLVAGNKVEREILSKAEFEYATTGAQMIRRTGKVRNVLFPLYFTASLIRSYRILREFKPLVAVGTGGYVSVPPVLAAWLLRIPTLIQEQNSYPGLATRLLASFVTEVHLAFEGSKRYIGRKRGLHVSGNPVRVRLTESESAEAVSSREEDRKYFGLDPGRKTLLVFGGSQGARSINLALLEAIPELRARDNTLQVIWIMGKRNFKEMTDNFPTIAEWEKEGFLVCRDYLFEMWRAYSAADMVVSRAGALTLAEITLTGLPSILIPFPHAAGNHQTYNARSLAGRGAAVLLEEKNLSGEKLANEIVGLLSDERALDEMHKASRRSAFPRATQEITRAILDLAGHT